MSDQKPNAFPQRAEAIVADLTELFRREGNRPACEVLENAEARIEETGYDNWNGGTDIYTLFLHVPFEVFVTIKREIDDLEKTIGSKLWSVSKDIDKFLGKVAIKPILNEPAAVSTKVALNGGEHLWKPGMFRLFLSHVSMHKIVVAKLKWKFRTYGVSCFLAHEDIEPTLEWQHQIELALRSMHALLALLTPDFHASRWTDQEIGYALGRGVLVIPVRLGLDPYGFIGKVQGAPGSLENPSELASMTVDMLLKNGSTGSLILDTLIGGLEKSSNWESSKAIVSKLEAVPHLTIDQLRRMEAACFSNSEVSTAWGVPNRIKKLVKHFKTVRTANSPF